MRENPSVLLTRVVDRASFIEFVAGLAEDRRLAETEEQRPQSGAQWGAVRGWQNTSISAFLEAAALVFEDGRYKDAESNLTWREFAEFLYLGKIYE